MVLALLWENDCDVVNDKTTIISPIENNLTVFFMTISLIRVGRNL